MNTLPDGYWIDEETGAWHSYPWPTDPDEKRHLIENSLGPLVIRWAENDLSDEEYEQFGPGLIDPIHGGPLRLNANQKRLLILHFAFNPDDGRWLYRRAVRGTIADDRILDAVLAVIEDIGPSRLQWHEENGWTGSRRDRWRVPALLSDEAKRWHA